MSHAPNLLLAQALLASGLANARAEFPAPKSPQTCNLPPEVIEERERPVSRQVRRRKQREEAKRRSKK